VQIVVFYHASSQLYIPSIQREKNNEQDECSQELQFNDSPWKAFNVGFSRADRHACRHVARVPCQKNFGTCLKLMNIFLIIIIVPQSFSIVCRKLSFMNSVVKKIRREKRIQTQRSAWYLGLNAKMSLLQHFSKRWHQKKKDNRDL